MLRLPRYLRVNILRSVRNPVSSRQRRPSEVAPQFHCAGWAALMTTPWPTISVSCVALRRRKRNGEFTPPRSRSSPCLTSCSLWSLWPYPLRFLRLRVLGGLRGAESRLSSLATRQL